MVADLEWRLAQALVSSVAVEQVERDLNPPDGYGELTRGWDFNSHTQQVYKACSSAVSHGHGWEKTNSQRPVRLFSTEILAMKALRNAVYAEMVRRLADIDMKIASRQSLTYTQ